MDGFTRISCVILLSWCLAGHAAEPEASAEADLPKTDETPSPILARFDGKQWFYHGSVATGVCYSSDGCFIASAHYDGLVRLWNATSGNEVRRLAGHKGKVFGVAFTTDGRLVASVGDDKTVRVWETGAGRELHCLRAHRAAALSVAFSPDGKRLVTGDASGNVCVWDTSTWKLMHDQPQHAHESTVWEIRFSPNGSEFASAGGDGKVCFWHTRRGKVIDTVDLAGDSIGALAYSPDGKHFAVGDFQGQLWLRDPQARADMKKFDLSSSIILAMTFTNRGLAVAIRNSAGLQLVDPDNGKSRTIDLSKLPIGDIRSISVNPQGTTLVAGGDFPGLYLLDLTTLEPVQAALQQHHGPVTCLSFSPDGAALAWGGTKSSALQVSNIMSGQPLLAAPQPADGVLALLFSPDGKHIGLATTDDLIHLINVKSGKPVERFNDSRQARCGGGNLVFSKDGTSLMAISPSGYHLCEADTSGSGEVRQTCLELFADAGRLLLSPDGKRLARLGDGSGEFELLSLRMLQRRAQGTGKGIDVCGAFSADGKVLVTSDLAGSVYVWDAETGTQLSTWVFPSQPSKLQFAGKRGYKDAVTEFQTVHRVAVSPDGRTAAMVLSTGLVPKEDGGFLNTYSLDIQLYELSSHQLRATLHGHTKSINCLAFSPDGRLLASGSDDESCIVWDLTGRHVAGLPKSVVLTRDDCYPLWQALLSQSGEKPWRALWTLVAGGDSTIAFLREQLVPMPTAAPAKLIAALDDDSFDKREAASRSLALLGDRAENPLRDALAADPTPEAKRRIEQLLADHGPIPTGEKLRYLRAIEVLEHIATPDARRLLEKLANGDDSDDITKDVKASLERLARR